MTWYYWILIRRNLDQFDFFTLRIMKLLEWKLVRLSTSWSGSGATSHAGLCRRWRPGCVAGHSPRSGPGSAGGSRPWTPAGSTPTRLSRHNMYLQSVIVKWQYFTFGSKLPVNLPGVESIRALHGGIDMVLQAAGSLNRYWLVLASPGH